VVLIDHGHVIYDGALEALRTRFGRQRTLVVDLDQEANGLELAQAELVRREGPRVWLRFDREAITAAALIAEVATRYRIRDLTVEEPEIEGIVRGIYETGSAA
jgi:ABC-2 type transport system ATP-binding protein